MIAIECWDELGWENAPLKALALVPDGYVQSLRQAGVYLRNVGRDGATSGAQRGVGRYKRYAPPWAVQVCEACKRYRSPTISSERLHQALVNAQEDMELRSAFETAHRAGGAAALAEMVESSDDRAKRKSVDARRRKLALAEQRVKEWTRKAKLAETKLSHWQRRLRAAERAIATGIGTTPASDRMFVIAGPLDDDGRLYWSNADGWVDKASATRFTESDTYVFTDAHIAQMSLPAGQHVAVSWVEVDK